MSVLMIQGDAVDRDAFFASSSASVLVSRACPTSPWRSWLGHVARLTDDRTDIDDSARPSLDHVLDDRFDHIEATEILILMTACHSSIVIRRTVRSILIPALLIR